MYFFRLMMISPKTTLSTIAIGILLLLNVESKAQDEESQEIIPTLQEDETSISPSSTTGYRSPVDFPITLAGNVGEIRADHFHTGIDIKALKGIGSPVRAVADGYISRIGVSPTGYGNVLYVTHGDGAVSVYGHLDRFASNIARWVLGRQRQKESFAVDLYPDKGLFPVSGGQQIATLGNSGSSGGPHLHFEIRNPGSGNPRNIIHDGTFSVPDRLPPTLGRILIFEVDTLQGVPHHSLGNAVAVSTAPDGSATTPSGTIPLARNGYLAYELIDYKDGRSNTMGVYSVQQSVNGAPSFGMALDEVNFATTRYINTLTSYAENRASRFNVIRAYVSPNNVLKIYRDVKRRGIIAPPEMGDTTRVETIITDDAGNDLNISFGITRADIDTAQPAPQSGQAVQWYNEFKYTDPLFEITIPRGALYESCIVPLEVVKPDVVRIGSDSIPLQRAYTLRLDGAGIPAALQSKALIVAVKPDGKRSSAGGTWKDGAVEASLRRFGHYAVAVDTIAPKVTPGAKSGSTIAPGKSLRFSVTDDLSGIAKYRLTVDGTWALISYDPRVKLLEHEPIRSGTPRSHAVTLTVTDDKGNATTTRGNYIW